MTSMKNLFCHVGTVQALIVNCKLHNLIAGVDPVFVLGHRVKHLLDL